MGTEFGEQRLNGIFNQGLYINYEFLTIAIKENMSSDELLLMALIESLDDTSARRKYGGCYASDEYLAKYSFSSINKVQKHLDNLIKCGLIEIVHNSFGRVIISNLKEKIMELRENAKN